MHALARPGFLVALWAWAVATGCVDAHWQSLRWPIPDGGLGELPAQPLAESPAVGVALAAEAMTWESEAVIVELAVHNLGDDLLVVERAAIMLAWDELEYAPDPPRSDASEPARVELAPGQKQLLQLRYVLGRRLIGSDARLLLRGATRGTEPIIELPTLALPGMPDPS